MTPVLLPIALASLVGSLHCAGMCGGLAAFASAGGDRPRALPVVAYNVARGAGYVALGAIAGTLGAAVDSAGIRVGVGRAAGGIAGAVMLAWGAMRLLEAAGVGPSRVGVPDWLSRHIASAIARVKERPPLLRAAVVGGCTAALPCGWLHAFTVVAGGTGGAASGAAVMAAFWLGTLPALLGVGVSVQAIGARLRRHASLVGALALVCLGLASVLGRLNLPVATAAGSGVPDRPPCHAH